MLMIALLCLSVPVRVGPCVSMYSIRTLKQKQLNGIHRSFISVVTPLLFLPSCQNVVSENRYVGPWLWLTGGLIPQD